MRIPCVMSVSEGGESWNGPQCARSDVLCLLPSAVQLEAERDATGACGPVARWKLEARGSIEGGGLERSSLEFKPTFIVGNLKHPRHGVDL